MKKLHGHAKVTDLTIPLGFEVPSGDRIDVPLRHMAVTGQTQRSGKTTTLDALISRSGVRALAFITKRGEGSFRNAHPIQPYFCDEAGGRPYWEFVESIVTSTMGQKMKFERAWIVKAAKGAKSLRQVRSNLDKLQKRATRSMDQDIYMLLAEYLDIVLPQMRDGEFSPVLALAPTGLSVMDLTEYTEEMQMLIVRACILAIHRNEHDVVTIIPEAWKFVPESRMTPVKPAAERLVREGAGLGNFVWIDSQDIAGVSKLLLRAVTVWIIGVQREANEIRRTLSNIPQGTKKPNAADVATLGVGQFFACYEEQIHKTYVQPVWMSEGEAYVVAIGSKSIGDIVGDQMERGWIPMREVTVAEVREMFPPHGIHEGNVELEEDDDMAYDADKARLEKENLELRHKVDELTEQVRGLSKQLQQHETRRKVDVVQNVANRVEPERYADRDFDDIYTAVKARIISEAPQLLKLVTLKPEIEVSVQREVVKMDTTSIDGRIAVLLSEGFFDDPKSSTVTLEELNRRGWRSISPRLYESFARMTKRGFLFKDGSSWQAVAGMKVNVISA